MELKDNIIGKINLILLNMPDNVSDLAKIRYVYMKLGNLFCYDFKIIIDEDLALISVNYDEIGKYQTCTQIAEILNVILIKILRVRLLQGIIIMVNIDIVMWLMRLCLGMKLLVKNINCY